MKNKKPKEQGVALVVTVIVVAMLAVVGVAFMQSTSADRAASRSVANIKRAELAAEAGVAMASGLLARQMTNDHFIVVANTNRQLFVGNGSNQPAGTFAYTPAFSTTASVSNAVAPVVSAGMPSVSVPGGTSFVFSNLPGGLSVTSPVISWVYLTETNAAGVVQTNARFAFWVEDLAGKLDLSVVGTNTSSPAARRPTGTNPAEIALWAVFTNVISAEASGGAGDDLVNGRSNILTAATARLVASNVTTNMLADFAANLRHDTAEPETIPFGFGYADEGKPKFNLNTNISAGGVAAVASIISRNLPRFAALRSGAMDTNAYLNNIAANIVDYADTDSVPIVGPGDFPSWRGVEAVAWPNEIFTGFTYSNRTIESGSFRFPLQVQQFVEVWNLSSKPITFNSSTYAISNDLNIALRCSNWFGNLSSVDPANRPAWEVFTNGTVTMPPNSYYLLGTAPRTFTVNVPTNLVGTNPAPRLTINPVGTSLFNKYAVREGNNAVIDAAVAGRHPGISTNLGSGEFHYIVSASGFGLSRGANILQYNLAGGDPRGQLFMTNAPSMGIRFINSTPGSRNKSLQAIGAANTANPPVNWPDRGHSDAVDLGPSPGSASQPMSSFRALSGKPEHHLQKVNDSGSYSNIFELGNIFDPIRWADTANPFHPLDPAAWMLLSSASTVSTNNAGCGRNTLRVGRFEHPRFNTNGARAAQLLDIFAAGPAASAVVTNRIRGKININTAATNVLRALAAGVAHTADASLRPGGTSFYVPTNAVGAFVSGVTRFRSRAPFFAPSQLTSISTNTNTSQWPTNAVFGNFGSNSSGTANNYFGNSNVGFVTAWNDQAAEEWFAKVYSFATVRSRNFVVYSVGQALQPGTTNILSTSKQCSQIFIRPLPGGGQTTNSAPEVVQSWQL